MMTGWSLMFFVELLDRALLFNHYRIMFVYREVNLTFDLTLAPDCDHKIKITSQMESTHPNTLALHIILSLVVQNLKFQENI